MNLTSIYFEEKEIHPKDLASLLKTSASNLSHGIKYLVAKDLLLKSMNKEDSRKVNLKLTARGNLKVSKLIFLYNEIQNDFEQKMGEKSIMQWNKKAIELINVFEKSVK